MDFFYISAYPKHFLFLYFISFPPLLCAPLYISSSHLLLLHLLSTIYLSPYVGVPRTTSAAIAELSVWPQFVCLATPSPLVSGGLIVLFQLKSLHMAQSVENLCLSTANTLGASCLFQEKSVWHRQFKARCPTSSILDLFFVCWVWFVYVFFFQS